MDKKIYDVIKESAKDFKSNFENSEIPMYGSDKVPNRDEVQSIVLNLRSLFFPMYYGDKELTYLKPDEYSELLMNKIYEKLKVEVEISLEKKRKSELEGILTSFFKRLPEVQNALLKDVYAIFSGDPAASSKEEIILSYPGLFAIMTYRISHELYMLNVPIIPRMMSEYAHSLTGIDINPGATIGEYFMIDHGTGIVIGETAKIGNNVKMYQGATLGALSPNEGQELRGVDRHPKIGNNVTIYANATLLGGDTVVGDNTTVGGNCFITHSIEEDSAVSFKAPELHIKNKKK